MTTLLGLYLSRGSFLVSFAGSFFSRFISSFSLGELSSHPFLPLTRYLCPHASQAFSSPAHHPSSELPGRSLISPDDVPASQARASAKPSSVLPPACLPAGSSPRSSSSSLHKSEGPSCSCLCLVSHPTHGMSCSSFLEFIYFIPFLLPFSSPSHHHCPSALLEESLLLPSSSAASTQ